MHSNLALISRHPHAQNNHACIIISPNLPRAETAGLGGGSVQCMRSNSAAVTVPCHGRQKSHDRYLSRSSRPRRVVHRLFSASSSRA